MRRPVPGGIVGKSALTVLNVILYPKRVIEELKAQNEELANLWTALQSTRTFIDGYIADWRLTGAAFSAHKNYFEEGHYPFIDKFRSSIIDQRVENLRHIRHLRMLKCDYYNRNQLISEIDRLNADIACLNRSLYSFCRERERDVRCGNTCAMITSVTQARDTYSRMLAELDTYLQNTSHQYGNMTHTLQRVRVHLTRIQKQQQCPDTLVVTLPTLQEAAKTLVMNADGTIDMSALAALVQNPDGSIDWDFLREFDWDTLIEIIRHIEGEDVLETLLFWVSNAEEMLLVWGSDWNVTEVIPNDPMLLLQMLKDYRMIREINEVLGRDEFLFEAWETATPAERRVILQNFMDALVPIFGVDVVSEINFFHDRSVCAHCGRNTCGRGSRSTCANFDGRRRTTWGRYSHGTQVVGINSYVIRNRAPYRSYRLFDTIIHELRHAYQHMVMDNPDGAIVAAPVLDAWEANNQRREDGRYIRTGDSRASGDGTYTMEEYRNQPREVDAFAFGELRPWAFYSEGSGWLTDD